jgi:hypothetical protein
MRGSPLGAMVAAASLLVLGQAAAQTPTTKPAPKPPASAAKPAAKPAPAPAQAAPAAGALDIKGFRSATFGMTPAQVKTAVTNDFGPAAKIREGTNADQGTQFIEVSVDHLDPGPGAAQIGYVFGATSHTLVSVNVIWSTGAEPTDQERNAMTAAAEQLVAYFRAGPAPAKTSQGIGRFGTNGLLLYTAVDSKNAGVMVLIDGVQYQGKQGDTPITSPPPKGPATLRVAYAATIQNPDVKTIKPGSF